jgi:hypothetical protein
MKRQKQNHRGRGPTPKKPRNADIQGGPKATIHMTDMERFTAVNLTDAKSIEHFFPSVEGKGNRTHVPGHYRACSVDDPNQVIESIRTYRSMNLNRQNAAWEEWSTLPRKDKTKFTKNLTILAQLQKILTQQRSVVTPQASPPPSPKDNVRDAPQASPPPSHKDDVGDAPQASPPPSRKDHERLLKTLEVMSIVMTYLLPPSPPTREPTSTTNPPESTIQETSTQETASASAPPHPGAVEVEK